MWFINEGSLHSVIHPSVSDTLLYNLLLVKSSNPWPPDINILYWSSDVIINILTVSTCPVTNGCGNGIWPGINGNGNHTNTPVLVPIIIILSVHDILVICGYEYLCCFTIES